MTRKETAESAGRLTLTRKRSSDSSSVLSRGAAALVDGTAMYHAIRSLANGQEKFDYAAFKRWLPDEAGLEPDTTDWVLWTAFDPNNPGQKKFLAFAEKLFRLQCVSPRDVSMVNPSLMQALQHLPLSPGNFERPAIATAVERFSADIAFVAGQLWVQRDLMIVSDSYQLSLPLSRLAAAAREADPQRRVPTLAFFSSELDPRWHRHIEAGEVQFIDIEKNDALLRSPTSGDDLGAYSAYGNNRLIRDL